MLYDFKQYTILIVEDDVQALEWLTLILKECFYDVISAKNGAEAFEKFIANKIDIILTDIRMPIKNGIDFVEQIRNENHIVPIIYMSSFVEVDILLQAMTHCTNGFLIKPIQHNELFYSLNMGINRLQQLNAITEEPTEIYLVGGSCVNLKKQTVYLNNDKIFLSKKEIQLLKLLIVNKSSILSKDIIEEYLWVGSNISEGSVKTLINKLRDKIGKESITTVKNIGYQINILS